MQKSRFIVQHFNSNIIRTVILDCLLQWLIPSTGGFHGDASGMVAGWGCTGDNVGWEQGRDEREHQQLAWWAQPSQGRTTQDTGATAACLLMLRRGLGGVLGPGATTGEGSGLGTPALPISVSLQLLTVLHHAKLCRPPYRLTIKSFHLGGFRAKARGNQQYYLKLIWMSKRDLY